MPYLTRPDGVQLAWEERGEGPLIVVSSQFFGKPEVFEGLMADLARDHRVVTYDLRGTGGSTPQGPYDLETDADDLEALVEEVGGGALVLAMADGCNRAVRVAAPRPDLVNWIVCPGGNPVGRQAVVGTEGLAGSDSVLEALVEMMSTDYRGALRTMFSTANPDLDEDRVRYRVNETAEYCPHEAALPRMKAWIADDPSEFSRELGDRLWVLEHGLSVWFPIEVARRARKILPEAHIIEVENGPVSRPDITAGFVRALTVPSGAAVGSESRQQAL